MRVWLSRICVLDLWWKCVSNVNVAENAQKHSKIKMLQFTPFIHTFPLASMTSKEHVYIENLYCSIHFIGSLCSLLLIWIASIFCKNMKTFHSNPYSSKRWICDFASIIRTKLKHAHVNKLKMLTHSSTPMTLQVFH